MIGKIIKIFVKFAIGLIVGSMLFVWILHFAIDRTIKSSPITKEASYAVRLYEKAEDAEIGTLLQCPMCGKNFYKSTFRYSCCSEECENAYQTMKDAWIMGEENKSTVESYGKTFN